jgi:hypothetical protein
MRFAFVLLCLLLPGLAHGQGLTFVDVPIASARLNEQSFLADIVNRCDPRGFNGPILDTGSRPTDGHESTHRLNAYLRNQRGGNTNAFYVMSGKAVVLKEPRLRKRETVSFVPPSLRSFRFGTYVTGAAEWDACPLYLCDEWTSYVNGCFVALDDKRNGRRVEQADWASGPLELGIYSVGLGMAVEKYDPTYWRESQFREFLRWHWARAKSAYDHGKDVFPSSSQGKLLAALQQSKDAAGMRSFIEKHLDGVWLH